jgi:hypothetical protein
MFLNLFHTSIADMVVNHFPVIAIEADAVHEPCVFQLAPSSHCFLNSSIGDYVSLLFVLR